MAEEQLEMNTLPQTQDPKVSTVTENLAPPLNDAMVRQMVMDAEKSGQDVAADTSAQTLPPAVTDPTVPPAVPDTSVPTKFLKPDGSVDVDKLKASTEQLNEAIQQKHELQEKTVDDYVREYKEKERQFRGMPSNPDVIRRQIDSQAPSPAVPPAPPAGAVPPQQIPDNDLTALRQKIAEDLRIDPVGTIVDLVKAVSEKQLEPFNRERAEREQAARDEGIRRNLAEIAASDRRILDPQIYQAVTRELDNDPGYRNLRNPHLAAWSVVKERMRLGVSPQPAQPSRPASPILGGGTPPPAPSASGAVTPRALTGAISQAKTPQELAALEQQIRGMLSQMD